MSTLIIDYGMGNLGSVERSLEICGGQPLIAANPAELKNATRIILPGVGAFGDGMKNLREKGWIEPLREQVITNKTPLLGICLGMQLLAESSTEGGVTKGLDFIKGQVVRFTPTKAKEKIPHVGWNEVNQKRKHPIFNKIETGKDFYFVHSYYFTAKDEKDVIATTPYCGEFASVIASDNIIGAQFHPEKSQVVGLQFLKNFIESC